MQTMFVMVLDWRVFSKTRLCIIGGFRIQNLIHFDPSIHVWSLVTNDNTRRRLGNQKMMRDWSTKVMKLPNSQEAHQTTFWLRPSKTNKTPLHQASSEGLPSQNIAFTSIPKTIPACSAQWRWRFTCSDRLQNQNTSSLCILLCWFQVLDWSDERSQRCGGWNAEKVG